MDAFRTTKPREFGGNSGASFLRTFYFKDNMGLPFQVLNVAKRPDLFPDGFPKIRRHWIITGEDQYGKKKFAPPLVCSQGHASTGGHCLICYGKATGQITADHGQPEPGEDIMIPIYEHTRYRKVGQSKYEPLNPNIPLENVQGTFVGGFKVIYASVGQFMKLRLAHKNAQNVCVQCGGAMMLHSLGCGDCGAEHFNKNQLLPLNNDQYEQILDSEITCSICSHTGHLVEHRVCQNCKGTTPRTLYDIVIFGQRQKAATAGGGEKSEYSFPEAPQYRLQQLPEEDVNAHLQKIYETVNAVPSIAAQKKVVQIMPPAEWGVVMPQHSQSYGA